jgi:hypothetical protein
VGKRWGGLYPTTPLPLPPPCLVPLSTSPPSVEMSTTLKTQHGLASPGQSPSRTPRARAHTLISSLHLTPPHSIQHPSPSPTSTPRTGTDREGERGGEERVLAHSLPTSPRPRSLHPSYSPFSSSRASVLPLVSPSCPLPVPCMYPSPSCTRPLHVPVPFTAPTRSIHISSTHTHTVLFPCLHAPFRCLRPLCVFTCS